jgi:hypothetical protein
MCFHEEKEIMKNEFDWPLLFKVIDKISYLYDMAIEILED